MAGGELHFHRHHTLAWKLGPPPYPHFTLTSAPRSPHHGNTAYSDGDLGLPRLLVVISAFLVLPNHATETQSPAFIWQKREHAEGWDAIPNSSSCLGGTPTCPWGPEAHKEERKGRGIYLLMMKTRKHWYNDNNLRLR